jgi:hypothetical protein
MAAAFDEAQHKLAIDELKATTRVTMETVGVRFGRRVSTSIYREHLLRVPGSPHAPRRAHAMSFVTVQDDQAEARPGLQACVRSALAHDVFCCPVRCGRWWGMRATVTLSRASCLNLVCRPRHSAATERRSRERLCVCRWRQANVPKVF